MKHTHEFNSGIMNNFIVCRLCGMEKPEAPFDIFPVATWVLAVGLVVAILLVALNS
jgi:hypothetical protein